MFQGLGDLFFLGGVAESSLGFRNGKEKRTKLGIAYRKVLLRDFWYLAGPFNQDLQNLSGISLKPFKSRVRTKANRRKSDEKQINMK